MANLTQKVLRAVMRYGVDKHRLAQRQSRAKPELSPHRLGARHTWSDQELAAFEDRWRLGTRERLAYALLLYTGQRVGDVVRMRRQDISMGCINVVQQKTGTALAIPIHAKLYEALKAGPRKGMPLIGDQHGRALTRPTLTTLIKRAVRAAGLGPECVAHGLRKACLRRLAEHGGSTKEIAAVSGHKSLGEVERYTAAADQRKLSAAAMAKLIETKDEK